MPAVSTAAWLRQSRAMPVRALMGHVYNCPFTSPAPAGILMALFLNTSGGAWDNAKKYVGAIGVQGHMLLRHRALLFGTRP